MKGAGQLVTSLIMMVEVVSDEELGISLVDND
jgi:hypothetical protein